MEFLSNQDFYDFIDNLSKTLDKIGFSQYSKRFHETLHEIAWTTTSELFPELERIAEEALKSNKENMPKNIRNDLNIVIDTMKIAIEKANNPN